MPSTIVTVAKAWNSSVESARVCMAASLVSALSIFNYCHARKRAVPHVSQRSTQLMVHRGIRNMRPGSGREREASGRYKPLEGIQQ